MYTYIYMYIYIHIYICTCVHMCTYVYIYTYVYSYIHKCIYIYKYIYVCMERPTDPLWYRRHKRIDRKMDIAKSVLCEMASSAHIIMALRYVKCYYMIYIAVCCSVLQCAVCYSVLLRLALFRVCCSVLQCVAQRLVCSECVAACCSVLQCVAASFSVL